MSQNWVLCDQRDKFSLERAESLAMIEDAKLTERRESVNEEAVLKPVLDSVWNFTLHIVMFS